MSATQVQGLIFSDRVGFGRRLGPLPITDPFDDADLKLLLAVLVATPEHAPGWWEFQFSEIVQAAAKEGLFPWLFIGSTTVGESTLQLTQRGKSSLGKMLRVAAGRRYETKFGLVVVLSYRGRNRHRRYRIHVLKG